jgi:hypothetical protein
MSGHQGVDAAVPGRAALPQPTPPFPSVPPKGARWVGGREPGPRTPGRTRPHRQPVPVKGGEPDAASLPGGTPAPGRGGRGL